MNDAQAQNQDQAAVVPRLITVCVRECFIRLFRRAASSHLSNRIRNSEEVIGLDGMTASMSGRDSKGQDKQNAQHWRTTVKPWLMGPPGIRPPDPCLQTERATSSLATCMEVPLNRNASGLHIELDCYQLLTPNPACPTLFGVASYDLRGRDGPPTLAFRSPGEIDDRGGPNPPLFTISLPAMIVPHGPSYRHSLIINIEPEHANPASRPTSH
ncbi:hypothetical protein NPX13_g1134 [Xylaria arbuscula]|uniref:Uncharacterized protein n=1 Tax=Xylaria arbuscula TaxID=114810 RepID=A0A9W8NNA3_9PEZI|nr:hypothetical protein NPX13_g1134 [Xylaria arbuscula]